MAFGKTLAAVRKRDVELDDQVTVSRLIQGPARAFAPLDDSQQRKRRELALGVALLDPGPQGRPLSGVLTQGKGVKETEPPRVGDALEPSRGALVLFVARALEQSGVARKEVQVPVFDGHFSQPPKPGLRQCCRSSALHTTPVSYVFGRGHFGPGRAGVAPPSMRMASGSPNRILPISGGLGPLAHIVSTMGRVIQFVWVATVVLAACAPPKLAGTELGAIDAPDFTLMDGVSGRSVTLSAQRGQVVALTFLFTTCPDVCPLTASRFRAAQTELQGDANRVTFIAVSVDPDRDTPETVRVFSAAHGLTSNWYYLVGGRAQLAPVWAAYGIGVQAGSTTVTHNDAVYLIDARGRERVLLHSEDLAADLVNDLRALLRS
jgi:protein SCO1/2